MEVTVENVVEVKADISIDQMRKYLSDHGWERTIEFLEEDLWEFWDKEFNGRKISANIPIRENYYQLALCFCLSKAVHVIASAENRKPGDVLLDIAKIDTTTEKL